MSVYIRVQNVAVTQLVLRRCLATHSVAAVRTLTVNYVSVKTEWLVESVIRVSLATGTFVYAIHTAVKVTLSGCQSSDVITLN